MDIKERLKRLGYNETDIDGFMQVEVDEIQQHLKDEMFMDHPGWDESDFDNSYFDEKLHEFMTDNYDIERDAQSDKTYKDEEIRALLQDYLQDQVAFWNDLRVYRPSIDDFRDNHKITVLVLIEAK
jgi:hypothetical protein